MPPIVDATDHFQPERVFCIGRNYAEHIREFDNDPAQPPVIFMKPPQSLLAPGKTIDLIAGAGALHYETELVVLIGSAGKVTDPARAPEFIRALGVGSDLTLRELQTELRRKGAPWECSKAFEKSAPLGWLHTLDPQRDRLEALTFAGYVNGELRQSGCSGKMIYPIVRLLVELSRYWSLLPGDLIYTGTPSGVGELHSGDVMKLIDHRGSEFSWRVSA